MEINKTLNGLKIFFTAFGLVSLLLDIIFAYLNNTPLALKAARNSTVDTAHGVFLNEVENLGKKYPSTISPAPWVFAIIWAVIFLWNTIGSLYMTSSLCLPTDRSPVLREPAMIPMASLVLWIVSWWSSFAWIFTYDREYFGVSLFFLILGAWTGYAFLGVSYRSYFSDILLIEEHNNKMLWLVRILIHNGFAIYATWLTCAWKLNLATVITYVDSRGIDKIPADLNGTLTPEDAGTVALALILFEVIVWFVLENFVFEPYCRYTLTIYPTLILAFSGIFVRNYVFPFSRNQSLTLVGLGLTCIIFCARIPLVIYRHKNRMRYA